VVVRFARARKRYERQGLLVAPEAIARAEKNGAADAPERAAARARAALFREDEDREFVAALTAEISQRYPACPPEEAHRLPSTRDCAAVEEWAAPQPDVSWTPQRWTWL